MALITNEINAISTAKFGKDVRGSIVTAFTKMNSESEDAKNTANNALQASTGAGVISQRALDIIQNTVGLNTGMLNLLKNGDFANGSTHWITLNPNVVMSKYSEDQLLIDDTKTDASALHGVYQIIDKSKIVKGHIYYISVESAPVMGGIIARPGVYIFNEESVTNQFFRSEERSIRTLSTNIEKSSYRFSLNYNMDTSKITSAQFRILLNDKEGKYYYQLSSQIKTRVTKPYFIDLTESFGAGNEPTLNEMDFLTSNMPYFTDIIPIGAALKGLLKGLNKLKNANNIRNTVQNGEFMGTVPWDTFNTELTALGNGRALVKAIPVSTGVPVSHIVDQAIYIDKAKLNHKIYVGARVSNLNPNIELQLTSGYINNTGGNTSASTYLTDDKLYGGVVNTFLNPKATPIAMSNKLYILDKSTGGSIIGQGETFNIEAWIVIDLTEEFGAGNEPTAEDMNDFMGYINGWSDYIDTGYMLKILFRMVTNRSLKNNNPWTEPTLLNGWNVLDINNKVRYYKDSMSIVHLEGLLKGGTPNSVAFILPAGYRPKQPQHLIIFDINGDIYRLNIVPNGQVIVNVGSKARASENWLSLYGISFRAEV